jgi:PKD repeat protein
MKQLSGLFLFGLMAILLFSCKKEAEIDLDKLVQVDSVQITKGAIISVDRDTTTVSYGNIEAKFSQTSTCYPSKEVFTFTASGVGLPAGGYYSWSFGDGNIANGATTTHSYQAAGSFVVTLMVMANANNMLAKVSFGVKALGQQTKPEAIFSTKFDFPQNVNYVTFNSASSINQGDIIQFKYNWGDGTEYISSVGLVRHEFPKKVNDTTYAVKLTVLSNFGCSDDTTVQVTIPGMYNIKGKFKTESIDACTNERILFTAEAENVPTGSVYEWDFSDGTGTRTGNPILYKYKHPNDYDVIMTIKLNGRVIYKTNKLVNSKGENPRPKAVFEETLVWDYPTYQRWSFNSKSTIPTSTIDSYQWNFGNGITNNEFYSFIETSYNKESTSKSFTVQLIVTGNGCADTARKTITIPPR